jgi:hypothetical protein
MHGHQNIKLRDTKQKYFPTRQAVHIVGLSSNNGCRGNTTMNSVYVVAELQVTVNYIKTLSVAQQCFYGTFRSSATVK